MQGEFLVNTLKFYQIINDFKQKVLFDFVHVRRLKDCFIGHSPQNSNIKVDLIVILSYYQSYERCATYCYFICNKTIIINTYNFKHPQLNGQLTVRMNTHSSLFPTHTPMPLVKIYVHKLVEFFLNQGLQRKTISLKICL